MALLNVPLACVGAFDPNLPERPHVWNAFRTSINYGLVDLDGFATPDYAYCKWGNYLSIDSGPGFVLPFDWLTRGPFSSAGNQDDLDLFLSPSQNALQRASIPPTATWTAPNGLNQPGSVSFSSGDASLILFRYLHFRNSLQNVAGRTPDERSIDDSTRKLIVLIHGWNPNSDGDAYDSDQFLVLKNAIAHQLPGSNWKLITYHWEPDADTGPAFFSAPVNATEAAEISHQHGQHLGELLNSVCPNLEKVHFLAHSAGSWAARAATKFLLANNATVMVQVTLLDPFIPRDSVQPRYTPLTKEAMSGLASVQGNGRLVRLENYYAKDAETAGLLGGTEDLFAWRGGDTNLQVDWPYFSFAQYYSFHAGPIQFYADTVNSTVSNACILDSLAGAGVPYDYRQVGWWRSLFFQETGGQPFQVLAVVPGVADIALAGQTNGAANGRDSVPTNSPVEMVLNLVLGQSVEFPAVSGQVDLGPFSPSAQGPEGYTNDTACTTRQFGLSSVCGPYGGLVGVFFGSGAPDPAATPPNLDFSAGARELPVVSPLLQQVFYIGNGYTPAGQLKKFMIPAGAARLYLGVLDLGNSGGYNYDNCGSFSVSAVVSTPPPPPTPGQATVYAVADIALAGQTNGTFNGSDSALLNSPVEMVLNLVAGQAVQFWSASGQVGLGPFSPTDQGPEGYTNQRAIDQPCTTRGFGLSSVCGPYGGLVGVFLGSNGPNPATTPPSLDFTAGARELPVVSPLLQQVFYIGNGYTPAGQLKKFMIPAGAARLYLGVLDLGNSGGYNYDNCGSFSVSAVVSGPPPPPMLGQATVYAVANIALAGQTNGTNDGRDNALLNSPVEMVLNLVAGQAVEFPAVSGQVGLGFYPSGPYGPEGYTNQSALQQPCTSARFGLSSVCGPYGGLVGVFLGSNAPNPAATPPNLDFRTQTERDVQSRSPVLQQVFYVGSGRTSSGVLKTFIVPTNATRLYLGVLDLGIAGGSNHDNSGSFSVLATVFPSALFNAQRAGSNFNVSFFTVTNKTYALEFTSELKNNPHDTIWNAVPGTVTGDGTLQRLIDPSPAAAQRFYRLRIE